MKAIITGARGTVGSALSNHLTVKGHQIVGWDRGAVPIDRYQPMEDFVRQERPDVLFHLAIASRSTGVTNESWLVNYEWASELAWITGQLGCALRIYQFGNGVFGQRAGSIHDGLPA